MVQAEQERLDKNADLLMSLGVSIRARRMELRLNQKDVAQRMGVDTAMVSQYETGKVDIPYTRLHALAEALDTTVVELIVGRKGTDAATTDAAYNYMVDALRDPDIKERMVQAMLGTLQPLPCDQKRFDEQERKKKTVDTQ